MSDHLIAAKELMEVTELIENRVDREEVILAAIAHALIRIAERAGT